MVIISSTAERLKDRGNSAGYEAWQRMIAEESGQVMKSRYEAPPEKNDEQKRLEAIEAKYFPPVKVPPKPPMTMEEFTAKMALKEKARKEALAEEARLEADAAMSPEERRKAAGAIGRGPGLHRNER